MLKNLSDAELVIAFYNGNNLAFDELYNRNAEKLRTIVYFKVRNHDVVNDLIQEIFIRACILIKNDKYIEYGKFSHWLSQMAYTMSIDYLRKKVKNKTIVNENFSRDLFNDRNLSERNIEDEIIKSETENQVRLLITTLNAEHLDIIIKRYFKKLKFKDIAKQKDLSVNTTLGMHRYAIGNLRKLNKILK